MTKKLAALDRYRDHMVGGALADLERPGASVDQIGAYLDGLVQAVAAGGPARFGCLMANTMSDLAVSFPRDGEAVSAETGPATGGSDEEHTAEEVSGRVLAHLDRLVAAFQTALTTARERGEVRPGLDAAVHAHQLAVTVQGISTCARLGRTDVLQHSVEATMSALTADAPSQSPPQTI
ncbi:hypothetical protein [Streptomyces sp. NPDC018352]|uniref:TetR family transcriptional regulator C-terminal domain-containing protein n=1 Tax=Streptomyces sp. NPDC018352 TaxID=3157194 RepID=UPI0033E5A7C7